MKYGKKLKELRKAKDKTLKEVARSVGIGISTLHDYENDKCKNPRISVLEKLCKYYGVEFDIFLTEEKIVLNLSNYTTIGLKKAIENHIAEENKKYNIEEKKNK